MFRKLMKSSSFRKTEAAETPEISTPQWCPRQSPLMEQHSWLQKEIIVSPYHRRGRGAVYSVFQRAVKMDLTVIWEICTNTTTTQTVIKNSAFKTQITYAMVDCFKTRYQLFCFCANNKSYSQRMLFGVARVVSRMIQ